MQLGFHVSSRTSGLGASSDSGLPVAPVPLSGLPCLVSVEKDVSSPVITHSVRERGKRLCEGVTRRKWDAIRI